MSIRLFSYTFTTVLIAVIFFFSLSFEASAQTANPDIIPCGTSRNPVPCQPCHIVVLGVRLINFAMFYLALPGAVLMITYAGFVYITSFGRPSRIGAANTILWNTLVGILIVFGGFFLVDVSIKILSGDLGARGFQSVGPWNDPFQAKTPELAKCAGIIPAPSDRTVTPRQGESVESAASRINAAIARFARIVGNVLLIVSPLMILYAAWLYASSGGDPKQTTAARRILLFAVIAVIVAALSFALPALVSRIFTGGADSSSSFEQLDIQ